MDSLEWNEINSFLYIYYYYFDLCTNLNKKILKLMNNQKNRKEKINMIIIKRKEDVQKV